MHDGLIERLRTHDKEAANAIEKLQADVRNLKGELNAAIADLSALRKVSGFMCFACYYAGDRYDPARCNGCDYNDYNNWVWEGVEYCE